MEVILFFIVAAVMLASGIMVVTQRNPVMSVVFLIIAFFSLAVLYIMLGAQFIAVMQVIVYAGAIMVLFVFVVMMLNLGAKQKWEVSNAFRTGLGFGVAGLIFVLGVLAIEGADQSIGAIDSRTAKAMLKQVDDGKPLNSAQSGSIVAWFAEGGAGVEVMPDHGMAATASDSLEAIVSYYKDMGTVEVIGENLFRRYLIPFEVASVLLLAAIIGVVGLVKRKPNPTETAEGGAVK